MLDMQKKYMCLHTDKEIVNMDRDTIITFLQKHKITCNEEDLTYLTEFQEKFKCSYQTYL